jgi:hypothetical protein
LLINTLCIIYRYFRNLSEKVKSVMLGVHVNVS